jgi:hypothetical protein
VSTTGDTSTGVYTASKTIGVGAGSTIACVISTGAYTASTTGVGAGSTGDIV